LSRTATRLCFADGAADARVMLIGEAPGSEEDREGRPFVGQSGQFLDRMLAAVGLDRSLVWITNTIFWRPPGNRSPTTAEVAVCQPFLERQIEILTPAVMVFLGGAAVRALLGREEGITQLRGRRFTYESPGLPAPIPALAMFHPAYLLRQPLNKRYAWRDLLTLDAWLTELGSPRRP
jgi:DNA polymerase